MSQTSLVQESHELINRPTDLLINLQNRQEMNSNIYSEARINLSNQSLLSFEHNSDEKPSISHESLDPTKLMNNEVNELIQFLKQFANSSLKNYLETCIKQNQIDSNSIIKTISVTPSSNADDPLFLSEFIRTLRKELQDAESLREIDLDHLSSVKLNNTVAGDNIDQDRVSIEIIHNPSKCIPDSELSHLYQYHHHPTNIMNTYQSQQWIRSSNKNCVVTSNSLFYSRKSIDNNTHSISVEHNKEFQ
ncbi:hypothetical protein I4U23_006290 [Adineta vaga]|nr:hypothetical protein I4U23_006290 [Adineta vaga]